MFPLMELKAWDTRWTIEAVLNAVVFQLLVLQRIYDEMAGLICLGNSRAVFHWFPLKDPRLSSTPFKQI